LLIALSLAAMRGTAQSMTYDTLPNMPAHYLQRVEAFRHEPVVTGKVMMVGNSLTEGGDWKKWLNDTSVINRGIGGDVTFGVLRRLPDITERKPSKLFLLIGINDLSRNTPDEVIMENIFTIASKIRGRSRKTKIFVQSILPTNDTFKNLEKKFLGKGEHIVAINEQLRKYAAKMHYTFVDLYSHVVDGEGRLDARYTTDGLHLNAAGYKVWVEWLKKENL